MLLWRRSTFTLLLALHFGKNLAMSPYVCVDLRCSKLDNAIVEFNDLLL